MPLRWRQILLDGDPEERSEVKVMPLYKVQALIWQVSRLCVDVGVGVWVCGCVGVWVC